MEIELPIKSESRRVAGGATITMSNLIINRKLGSAVPPEPHGGVCVAVKGVSLFLILQKSHEIVRIIAN